MNETITVQSGAPAFLQFLPLIFLTLPFLILIGFISQRKGVNIALSVIVGLIPMVNIVYALWLVSRTDTSVLNRLAQLEKQKG